MTYELIKFTPPDKDINRKVSPNLVYELERQAGAVIEAQNKGRLSLTYVAFKSINRVEEGGQIWYIINSHIKLYSGDCDEEIIQKLVPDEFLIDIYGLDYRPDVSFGREEMVVAAILRREDSRALYKSPEFDLETYREKHNLWGRKKNRDEG